MRGQGELSGRQKAAVLLISLGPDISARVMKQLKEEDIEELTLEIAATRQISSDHRNRVFEEFVGMAMAQRYIDQGGIEYAQEVLERAVGEGRAKEILERLTASLQVRPFDFVRKTDATQILNFLQNEHPQTIALVLSYLHADQAAAVISALPPERQADVARRIAIMDRTSPDILRELERVLERKLSTMVTQDFAAAGGIEAIVEIINKVDRSTEKTIMETLEVQDPELAEEIKKRMFLFEDIILLADRSVQRVLREVDSQRDLPLALKAASEEVRQKIFRNMSKRAGENLRENMEFLGPVRLRDVEEAQQKIVAIIRRLEEEGEIIVSRGGGDEVIV